MNTGSKYKTKQRTHLKKKKKINIKKSPHHSNESIIIKSPFFKTADNPPKIYYPIEELIQTDFNKIKNSSIHKIVLCIYRINTNTNNYTTIYPYLEYLLYKYPHSHKKNSNTCVFPFINFNGKQNIKTKANELCSKITNKKLSPIGFLEINDKIFVFYNITAKIDYKNLSIKYLDSKVELWWTLMDEICNHQKILTYNIHHSVYNLFYKNPGLIYLRNPNGSKFLTPKVAYIGGFEKTLPSIALSVNTLQESYYHKELGCFNFAVRDGGWTNNFKPLQINDTIIADKQGRYTQGGLVRFAVFSFETNVLTSKSEINQHFKSPKQWIQNYDMLFFGKTHSHHIKVPLPHLFIKTFSQKTPLSIHLLNMTTLKKWNPTHNYQIE